MVAPGDSGQDSGEEEKSECAPAEDGFNFAELGAEGPAETPPPFRSGEFDFPFGPNAANLEA